MLLPNARLLHPLGVAVSPDRITLVAVTVLPQSSCPVCDTVATRVQSTSLRRCAALPCASTPTCLNLYSRPFFCDAPNGPRVMFTERLPEVAAPSARRTIRLAAALQQIAPALGGAAGARRCTRLEMPVSGDTLLRQRARRGPVERETPRVLGVDDGAPRKGQTYGTIRVDLEQRCVVELLPDRAPATLTARLKAHPGVEIIARDRSGAAAAAARAGAPGAVQVADRWHLLQPLAAALEGAFTREERARQPAATPPPTLGPPAEGAGPRAAPDEQGAWRKRSRRGCPRRAPTGRGRPTGRGASPLLKTGAAASVPAPVGEPSRNRWEGNRSSPPPLSSGLRRYCRPSLTARPSR